MEQPNYESTVPSPSTMDVPCSILLAAQDEVAEMTLTVKWSGNEYTVRVCGDDSVAELKRRICEVTNVLPKRQKLLYPKLANKLGDDSLILSQFNFRPSIKMTMIGLACLIFLCWLIFKLNCSIFYCSNTLCAFSLISSCANGVVVIILYYCSLWRYFITYMCTMMITANFFGERYMKKVKRMR